MPTRYSPPVFNHPHGVLHSTLGALGFLVDIHKYDGHKMDRCEYTVLAPFMVLIGDFNVRKMKTGGISSPNSLMTQVLSTSKNMTAR